MCFKSLVELSSKKIYFTILNYILLLLSNDYYIYCICKKYQGSQQYFTNVCCIICQMNNRCNKIEFEKIRHKPMKLIDYCF